MSCPGRCLTRQESGGTRQGAGSGAGSVPERAANCGHQRSPTGRRPGQPTRCTSGGAGLVPLACAGHRSPGDRCMSGKLEHPARACEHPRRPDCQGCSSTRCTQAPPGIRGATGSVKGWRRSNSLSIASRWAVAVTLTGEPGMARTMLKHAGILRIRSSPPAEGAGAVSAGPGQTAELLPVAGGQNRDGRTGTEAPAGAEA